jgi:SAM-dependent methyltransferase
MQEDRKLSKQEMLAYYKQVHRSWLERDPANELAPVLAGGGGLCDRFNDYAHRLGMRNLLAYLNAQWGTFDNRSVLDVGCGRGRWVREFASRGCQVTGVDISDEAVRLLAEKLRQHTFLVGDITDQTFHPETFDLVNSVTVLQHLPYDAQSVALEVISNSIKKNGYLLMLEACGAFSAGHVFPHSRQEWVRMVETRRLKLRACWGSNFEILFRACFRLSMALLHGAVSPRMIQARVAKAHVLSTRPAESLPGSVRGLLRSSLYGALALVSFPLEWFCHQVPVAQPTHLAMVFQKQ